MENAQFAILAALSALSLGICAYLLLKVRTITYLLEQPVVKKMSPQLKLKPVKVDEIDGDSRANQPRNNAPAAPSAPARPPRPAFEGGERPPRDNQNRDRAPRPDGEPRRDGIDRGPRNDRGDRGGERNDRFGGRDRGGRGGNDRNERHGGGREGGDRNRNRTESFSAERSDAAPVEGAAPRQAPVASEAPSHSHSHSAPTPAALAPRRPLPSTVDQEVVHKEIPVADALAANAAADDALFNRDDSDIQHGRRHQPKKKPRFDVAEEEAKTTEETKA